MSLTIEERDSVLANTLVLECPSLRLIPNSSEKPGYIGSGLVSLNEEGFFEVVVLLPKPLPFEEAMPELRWPIGEVLGEEHYYTLEATDFKARAFEAKGLLPTYHVGPGGIVIHAKAPSVILNEESEIRSDKNYLSVTFAGEIRFPANTQVSEEKHIGGKRNSVKRGLSAAKFSSCVSVASDKR